MTTLSQTTETNARRKFMIVPEIHIEVAKKVCPDAEVLSFEDLVKKAGSSKFIKIEQIYNPTYERIEQEGSKTKKKVLQSATIYVVARINDLLGIPEGRNRWGHARVIIGADCITPEMKKMMEYHKDMPTSDGNGGTTLIALGAPFGTKGKRRYQLALEGLSNGYIGFELDTKETESNKKDENGSPYKFFRMTSFAIDGNDDGSFKWEIPQSTQVSKENGKKFSGSSFLNGINPNSIPSNQFPTNESSELVKSEQGEVEA